jgi:hypothetical protein
MCDPQALIKYGRPLWSAQSSMDGANTSLSVAMSKLACQINPEWSLLQSLAILGSRIHLDVVPRSQAAAELVAGFMRMMVFINKPRDCLFTMAASEPTVAEGAAQLMHRRQDTSPTPSLIAMLERLREAVVTNFVEAGPRGELVARILLLLAADHARLKLEGKPSPEDQYRFSRPITVRQYLDSLLGQGVVEWLNEGHHVRCRARPRPGTRRMMPSRSMQPRSSDCSTTRST